VVREKAQGERLALDAFRGVNRRAGGMLIVDG
jgi:hypothetical protein